MGIHINAHPDDKSGIGSEVVVLTPDGGRPVMCIEIAWEGNRVSLFIHAHAQAEQVGQQFAVVSEQILEQAADLQKNAD